MIQQIKQHLLFGSTFYGIEYSSLSGVNSINIISLQKKKNNLEIGVDKICSSFSDVIDIIPKNSSVHLVINNEKVLTKQIEFQDKESVKTIRNAFPNINLEDFYYSILKQEGISFAAICRKKYVDEIISSFKGKNIFVLNVSLGNHAISNTLDFLHTDVIFTSNSRLEQVDSKIINIDVNEVDVEDHSYNINGLNISNSHVLPFSSVLGSIIKKQQDQGNFNSRATALKNDYLQNRFFNQFLKSSLVFILILLLINFMFFNTYFNKVSALRQTSQVNQASKERLILLKEDVSKKEKFIQDILKSGSSKSSFYTNSIMVSLPNSILINEIDYQPLLKRIKADKPIEYTPMVILLNGMSSVTSEISIWISKLEQLEWVDKVVIADYSELNNSLTEFNLKISIK